jgi:uncharacterized protein YgfB (UPF0149 family)
MDEEMKNESTIDEEELKKSVDEVLEKVRTQAMLLGARAMCVNIMKMIDEDLTKPGKRTMNDMKRIIKRVRDFCQVAVDHPVETPTFGEEADEA